MELILQPSRRATRRSFRSQGEKARVSSRPATRRSSSHARARSTETASRAEAMPTVVSRAFDARGRPTTRPCARRVAAKARPTATVADADDAYNAAMKAYSETPYEYKHELGLCACPIALDARGGGVFERERWCPRAVVILSRRRAGETPKDEGRTRRLTTGPIDRRSTSTQIITAFARTSSSARSRRRRRTSIGCETSRA